MIRDTSEGCPGLTGLLIAFSGLIFFQQGILEASVVPDLASGRKHVIHLRSDGTIWGWGDNSLGQLGNGSTESVSTPVQISSDTDWQEVSSGALHCIALKNDGTMWAWGDNRDDQLGAESIPFSLIPRQVGKDSDWFEISAGGFHNLAIRQDGSLWSWGKNSSGQLGDGTLINRFQPVRVGQGAGWTSITAGSDFSAAIQFNRSLWTWGNNAHGQLGVGHLNNEARPVQLGEERDWIQAVAGESHMLAIKENGKLFSWGDNEKGQLGVGELKPQAIYDNFAEFTGFFFATRDEYGDEVHLAEDNQVISEFHFEYLGNFSFTLRGTVVLRIYANDGPLLNNSSSAIPQTLLYESDAVSISVGANTQSFLGLSLQVPRTFTWTVKFDLPVPPEEGRVGLRFYDPPLIGESFDDYWRKTETGWKLFRFPGQDFKANFGALVSQWVRIHQETRPVAVPGGLLWKSIAAGTGYSTAVARNGSLWAWGSDHLESAGPARELIHFNPVQIGEELDWSFVTAGDGFNVGSRTDLSLWSWGNNGSGQLGSRDLTDRSDPVMIDLDSILHPPIITSAPKSLIKDPGKHAVFQVNVVGHGPIQFQWYHDGIPLEGATKSTLQVDRVQMENQGDYRVAVSNQFGEITSPSANLTVVDRVQITRHPKGQTVPFGAAVSFFVEADFIGKVQYEWHLSGSLIPDSNNPVLKLDRVSVQDEGRYTVRIQNVAGVVVSKEAVLTVLSAPLIISGPGNQVIGQGKNIFLSVFAIGVLPLRYQWFKDGEIIPDVGSSLLSIRDVQVADEGVYSVRVGNDAGTVTSFPARIRVNQVPLIGEQPVDLVIISGQSARFSVQASDGASLDYQWFFNNIEIPGAVGNRFNLPTAVVEDEGNYSVRIQNSLGFVKSRDASLRIRELPKIAPDGETRIVPVGSQVVWEVNPESRSPVSYQWSLNNDPLSRQNSKRLVLRNVDPQSAGTYRVRVTNEVGTIDGPNMNLVVVIPSGPRRITAGETADLGIEVFGAPDAIVQLQRNGMPLNPQPDSSFQIENISLQDSGFYQASVQAFQSARTFDLARLRVIGKSLGFSDRFENRILLNSSGGAGYAFTVGAGREPGEPDHAGKPGGHSLWYSWKSPKNGIATLKTLGSELDTRIAVYRGDVLTELAPVASDDDSGGFFSSEVKFPVRQDEVFVIAVDHAEERTGRIVLEWDVSGDGSSPYLVQPVDQLVSPGETAIFSAFIPFRDSAVYQWFFNGDPISGANSGRLIIESVDASAVGIYNVTAVLPELTDTLISRFAELTMTSTTSESSALIPVNKFSEAVSSLSVGALDDLFFPARRPGDEDRIIFTNRSSSVEFGEPLHCNRLGGASKWMVFQADLASWVTLEAAGRQFGTIAAVYELSQDDFKGLSPVVCSLPGVNGSSMSNINFQVIPGHAYALVVDSVASARDEIEVNLRFEAPRELSILPTELNLVRNEMGTFFLQPGQVEGTLIQWLKDGVDLPGRNQPFLRLPNALPRDTGIYQVRVTTGKGVVSLSATSSLLVSDLLVIDEQPEDIRAVIGSAAVFSVLARGDGLLTYQWKLNGEDLAGADESRLVIGTALPENEGFYQVVVMDRNTTVLSNSAELKILNPAKIISLPFEGAAETGSEVVLAVDFEGSPPHRIQWFFQDNPIAGAEGQELLLSDFQRENAGDYLVVIHSAGSVASSPPITIAFQEKPEIVTHPESMEIPENASAFFSVIASGESPFNYQWFLNDELLVGENRADLYLPDAGITDTGFYRVEVSNRGGSVLSLPAGLSILVAPEITAPPFGLAANAGDSVLMRVEAVGSPVLEYQWFLDGSPIQGAVDSVLVITADGFSQGIYQVMVSNRAGFAKSPVTEVFVVQPPVIVDQPVSKVAVVGDTVTFSVQVNGPKPFHFQWLKNGAPIDRAMESILILSSVGFSDAANYSVTIVNEFGNVTSQEAEMQVKPLARIRVADFFNEFGRIILTIEWRSFSGRTYRIDVSADLVNWTEHSITTAVADLTQIVDILNADQLIRFYRLTEVP